MQRNIIIDNISYKLYITKDIDTINIMATNNLIKNSYSIALDNDKLKNIVSDAGLVYNINKFYELITVSLNDNNSKVKLEGNLKGSKLILILSIQLIEYLGHTINYTIVLDEIVKSDIARLEEMIIDVHQIKNNIDNLFNERTQELENRLTNLNLSKNKWINIDPTNTDYYFGYDNDNVFSQTVKGKKTGKKVKKVIKIPDHIVEKSCKIKIRFTIIPVTKHIKSDESWSDSSDKTEDDDNNIFFQTWTKQDYICMLNEENMKQDPRRIYDEEINKYSLTLNKKIDINSDNNTIFMKIANCTVQIYLISYKLK